MVNLADSILALYPNSQPQKDWRVRQDSKGVQSIIFWNTATMGAQPSDETLTAATQAQFDAAIAGKKDVDFSALLAQASSALSTLDSFIAINAPNASQIATQTKVQAQILRKLIPALVKLVNRVNVPNL